MFFSGVSFKGSYSFLHSFMTLKNDDNEQNQKRANEMKIYSMLMNRNCQDVSPPQTDL